MMPTKPKLLFGTLVLNRPGDVTAECVSGMERPVGIAQQFASKGYEVGLPTTDDLVGLLWLGNETDSCGRDTCLASNLFREWNLIAWFSWYLRRINATPLERQCNGQTINWYCSGKYLT